MDVQYVCSYALSMPTISDFKNAFDVQPNTLRAWSGTFADFLDDGANPPKGETRIFTDKDGRVIALIASMRKDNKPYEAIRASLAADELGQWPIESANDAPEQDAPGEQDRAFALVTQLTAKASALEGEVGAIREERDHLRSQLKQEQQERLTAEIERAAAVAKLELLAQQNELNADSRAAAETEAAASNARLALLEEQAADAAQLLQQQQIKPGWWDRLLGR